MEPPWADGVADRLARAALLVSLGAVSYIVIISAYRLWFHPLAKFPGPVLNRISWASRQHLPRKLRFANQDPASRRGLDTSGTDAYAHTRAT